MLKPPVANTIARSEAVTFEEGPRVLYRLPAGHHYSCLLWFLFIPACFCIFIKRSMRLCALKYSKLSMSQTRNFIPNY